jgi:hypothetical protein
MMPHLQYLKLQLQFKSKITEHLYTKRELVAGFEAGCTARGYLPYRKPSGMAFWLENCAAYKRKACSKLHQRVITHASHSHNVESRCYIHTAVATSVAHSANTKGPGSQNT